MSEKMSVTKALVELKRLDQRIHKAINESDFVGYSEGQKPVRGYKSNEDFKKESSSKIQSILSLIDRRNNIKKAIVESNAATEIIVAGKKMSVAAAVERKISIVYEKSLLQNLRRAYLNVEDIVNNKNAQVLEVLDRNLQTLYGKEGSQRIKEEDFDSVAKPFLAQREFKMVYPDNLLKKTEEIEREVEDFLAEVDAVLSESNARTDIEI